MIKKLVHIADIHIKTNFKPEHSEILFKFIEDLKEKVKGIPYNEGRILILGDLYDQKLNISAPQNLLISKFLKELSKIFPVLIITGNHDIIVGNTQKVGPIESLINIMQADNIRYLDKELDFKSGIIVDDNIAWCVYSIFDEYKKPNFEEHKELYNKDNKLTYINLFHFAIIGSKTDSGYDISHGEFQDIFYGNELTLGGDIHQHQVIDYEGGKAIYSSSMIQLSQGENVTGHYYLLHDLETKEFEKIPVESEYGIYKFKISSLDNIVDGSEKLVNY